MTRVNKAKEVASYLKSAYPPTNSFLHYKKDWELLFAVILSAQATDKSVNEATEHLFAQYPDLKDFTAANLEGILKCIRHVGLGKSKANYLIETSSILLNKFDGNVPKDRKLLRQLPGVGYKTSGVVLAELYDYPFIPVDTHIFRVSHRIGLVNNKLTPEQTEPELEKLFKGEHAIDRHHSLILFGRERCKSQVPNCEKCPFSSFCNYNKASRKLKSKKNEIRTKEKK